ncbi:DUF5302 domain-containing protein [Streptomyces sp. RerS4]|uniref:DUF5302 domain-containing protein n=1 Tax=Streptomyces sp. RerS4 TaxID=2942449 RepID=UPI00201CA91A|nr:DUF5302 domain-containing protein [Streptomyces sp. RerS4]UQW99724.1 DUF5302 domain-containing protein [Streptomyces sp. RerS4]
MADDTGTPQADPTPENDDTPKDESPADAAKRRFREALARNAANTRAQEAHQSRAKVTGTGSAPGGGKNKKVRRKTG